MEGLDKDMNSNEGLNVKLIGIVVDRYRTLLNEKDSRPFLKSLIKFRDKGDEWHEAKNKALGENQITADLAKFNTLAKSLETQFTKANKLSETSEKTKGVSVASAQTDFTITPAMREGARDNEFKLKKTIGLDD